MIVAAVLSKLSHRVSSALGNRERVILVLILLLATAALAFFVFAWNGGIVVAAMAAVFAVQGFSRPALLASQNRRVPSEKRSTCLSVSSAGQHFLGIALGPVLGHIIDARSLGTSLRVFLLMFAPLLIVCLFFATRNFGSTPSSAGADHGSEEPGDR
jgi:predicted MFS family arabinose efflux permease